MRRDPHFTPLLEELEPRILYAADLAPLLLAGLGAADTELLGAPGHAHAAPSHEIAFVDMSLPQAQSLVDDLLAQRQRGRDIEVQRIEAGVDGIAFVTDALAGQRQLSAVHLISHGSDAALQLGTQALDAQALFARAGQIAQWAAALREDADLLLYGCDVAQSAAGRSFITALA